jgi:hypothetical protein
LPQWIPKKDEKFPAVVEEHHMDTGMMKTMMIVVEAAEAATRTKMMNMTTTGEATGADMMMTMTAV